MLSIIAIIVSMRFITEFRITGWLRKAICEKKLSQDYFILLMYYENDWVINVERLSFCGAFWDFEIEYSEINTIVGGVLRLVFEWVGKSSYCANFPPKHIYTKYSPSIRFAWKKEKYLKLRSFQ